MNRWGLVFLLPIAATGCATVPKPLAGGEFVTITPNTSKNGNFVGQHVRWGGSIAKTEPGKNETCFEVVSYPLDSSTRPIETDITEGRFIACAPDFYDPEVYAKGREVTVIGNIQEATMHKVGEYEYHYPNVSAEIIYLWPKIIPYSYYGSPYYGNYYFGPFGWGTGFSSFGYPYRW